MKKNKPFEIYRDKRGKYRWRVTAQNGRILAQSSESYTRRIDCLGGAALTMEILYNTGTVWSTGFTNFNARGKA